MKEIKAIIRPFKLLEVTEELHKIEGLPGVTVSEIKGFGKSRAKNAKDKIVYEMVEFVPRIQLEVVVHDEMADDVVYVIQKVCPYGKYGRRKNICDQRWKKQIKIRTNERGRMHMTCGSRLMRSCGQDQDRERGESAV